MAFETLLAQTYFDNTLLAYSKFLVSIFVGLIAGKIIAIINEKLLKKLFQKTSIKIDDLLLELTERPIVIYIGLAAAYVGWGYLSFPNYPKVDLYASHILFLIFAINTAYLIVRLIRGIIEEYVTPFAQRTDTDIDDTLIPISKKLASFFVWVLAFIVIMDHFGQEIGPMLAGLGIGGLAFALAAKDLLANLFGSITVLMDNPFSRGDWIKINGVDGIVQEINLRTTTIKSWDNSLVYVPNAKFTDSILENVSDVKEHKIKMVLGLTYDTTNKKMEKAVEILKKIATTEKGLDHKQHTVAFLEFNDSSLDLLFMYYIKITDVKSSFEVRHNVNMRIKKEFEKAKINMAFPTRTVEMVKKK